jgi:hypothetical protein
MCKDRASRDTGTNEGRHKMGAVERLAMIALTAMLVSNKTEDEHDIGVTSGLLIAFVALHDGISVEDECFDNPATIVRRGIELLPKTLGIDAMIVETGLN